MLPYYKRKIINHLAIFLLTALLVSECSPANTTPEWVAPWQQHQKDFKTVVQLMKAKQLTLNKAGVAYIIPDSIHLQEPCEQMVYLLDDPTKDDGFSCLFYLSTESRLNRKNPLLVYTESPYRIKIYKGISNVGEIEKGWYFLYN